MSWSGIIQCNPDLTGQVLQRLVQQLDISEVIDGYQFQQRIDRQPLYSLIIHQNSIRLLVLQSYYDHANRDVMDIMLFLKSGLASVQPRCTKYCAPCPTLRPALPPCYAYPEPCHNPNNPPTKTYAIDRLTIYQISQLSFPRFDFRCQPGAQNNILFPLVCPNCGLQKFPFGSGDCNRNERYLPNPFCLPIACQCGPVII